MALTKAGVLAFCFWLAIGTQLAKAQKDYLGPHKKMNPKDNQTYVWIPAGNFLMGCSEGDSDCEESEKASHQEEITRGFWLGETEVTETAYEHVMGKNPSAHVGPQLPVENVAWSDAADYCAAIGSSLPSEEEWEYAARAGSQSSRYGNLDSVAWYAGNSNGINPMVRTKQPNAFGLYDMLGGVWEWTSGFEPSTGLAVVKGGARDADSRFARASARRMVSPSESSDDRGFRCAMDPDPVTPGARNPLAKAESGQPDPLLAGLPYPVFQPGRGVSVPKILRKIDPEYSEKARKAKAEGVVFLRIVIDPRGTVARAVVIKPLGLGLDEKAIQAVMRWKFTPGTKDGEPVAVVANFEVSFHLL